MAPSRPTTPIGERRQTNRRHSRRSSGIPLPAQSPHHFPIDPDNLPMDCPEIENKFKDIADGLEDLDVNIRDLNHIHDAVSSQFNESFASFLYGLSITMWCVDLPKCPSRRAWQRLQMRKKKKEHIAELKRKIEEAERLNVELKEKVAKETRPIRHSRPMSAQLPSLSSSSSSSSKRFRTNNENIKPVTNFLKKPNVAFTQTSKIPQPVSGSLRTHVVQPTSSNRAPNLNQPPRYMRGLFNDGMDVTPAGQRSGAQTKKRPQSLSQRPPFR
ncbi:DAM1 [Candida margitis]|uniref:DAM1 n=1 Tax=Candida margitis TaxID=1775924 RepID=UPI0022274BB5|nr:DAM1 [Candida margitis]KAI5968643.1 DAM1 [Candida margitis]